ncbi:LAMI_0F15610g1_1 [Lachancea mirantina]|uniref:LAMI_0F15610g1_1 n=1 Tax=Lachancea mirantina TaxID=1230905 RepID=A0A1G4K4D9_9SACH|nr:LAMI_0F15610g1_1 [Lachancea mirantina]
MTSDIAFVKSGDGTTERNLAGQYSAPFEIRDELETTSQRDVLMERMEAVKRENESGYKGEGFVRRTQEIMKTGQKRALNDDDDANNDNRAVEAKRMHLEDTDSYAIPETSRSMVNALGKELVNEIPGVRDLQFFGPHDKQYFGELLVEKPDMTPEEQKDRQFLQLLLRIKNGAPATRKTAMRMLRNRAADFGAPRIFDRVLPILLDKSLDDQERHLMVKAVDRVLTQLQGLVKPYAHQLLVVIAPSLIDEDPLARQVGRELISRLANAVGLFCMISTIRPDIDHQDEYVRNVTSRTLAVVARTLGVAQLVPFFRAVCHSRKSWRARHTGIRSIQHLSSLLGIAVLPYLTGLIECTDEALYDEYVPVRIAAAQCLASLAQNSKPYGIEAFNQVLEPLWKGIKMQRGKALASFLRALGFIIPLMDTEYAGFYAQEVLRIVKRELASPDDEMKKAVLTVLQQCCSTEAVTTSYLQHEILDDFFSSFWSRRIALDRQISKMATYTTLVLTERTGCSSSISRLIDPLRDESEPLRIMALHAVNRLIKSMGSGDIDTELERRLIDALLVAFQEQTNEEKITIYGFGTVALAFDKRMKPYLPPIVSTILLRLKHKLPLVRQQAADLCAVLIPVIRSCDEFSILNKLNIILYESLGEMFPEVLGSVIGAMSQIASHVDLSQLQPSPSQILVTLTPILRNRHRKVQEPSIELIGKFAKGSAESVPPKEWMRICFELLEMLKSTNKSIRRAANRSFGEIAKAIGPQDVLVTLLNNLKVQERQLRVCTAVAIGIVAETCGSFTVIPALMNEYKTPETNVQNGVLKAMTFMFEYIGKLSQNYIYFILPLLEDALTDRDLVHRQTASTVIRHLALNCMGFGNEDAFLHLLNLLMPNIFETSPHVIVRIVEGLDSLRCALGPGIMMNYVWAGLFHPAKNVRTAYWSLYNNAYIQSMDALVPYFPTLEEDAFRISELDELL